MGLLISPCLKRNWSELFGNPQRIAAGGILPRSEPFGELHGAELAGSLSRAEQCGTGRDWSELVGTSFDGSQVGSHSIAELVGTFRAGPGGIFWSAPDGVIRSELSGIFWSELDEVFRSEQDGIIRSERDGIFRSVRNGIFKSELGGIFNSELGGIFRSELDGIFKTERGGDKRGVVH